MVEQKATTLEPGDFIKENGTVHEVKDVDGENITIYGKGEMAIDYLQRGIDNGKVTITGGSAI